MKGIERIALLLFFLPCSSLLCFAQDARTKYQGKVVSVADGNTLTLSVDEQKHSVRLLGIDAPSQALRDASRENLSRLVSGKSVAFLSVPLELVAGKQKIQMGKVLLNDADVALSQLDSGFASQSNEFEKYQNPKEQQFYVIASRALCCHPILQTVAVKAASQAKFPRQLERITGNIVYNFVPE
jgi:endonuclease YncB( thermonuclease family)